jgi:iron complex transport system ATP-binding protein
MPVLLEARDLRFAYERERAETRAADGSRARSHPAVDGVSLAVPAGSVIGVLGPNGSGKTTLIKLLSGALAPRSGTIQLDGKALGGYGKAELARRLAVVPQDTHLAFDYTVLEIVLMGRYPRLGAFQVEGPDDLAAAFDALTATGTATFADRLFPTLSGGEKQRVIIASALAQLDERGVSPTNHGAALLFLDEPTASLDLRYQLELAALLRTLNRTRGITMMLSTHDLGIARTLCTHLMLLSRGRVLAEGAPADVLTAELLGTLYEIDPALAATAVR